MPYIGRTLGQGTRSRFLYTATAGQTTFSGSDSQSNTLAYADNNGLDCFQNGVLLKGGGADYTATTGTSVVLTTGASVDDVIEILVYDVFAIADHVKKSGDAMTGALTNIDVNGTELILDADGDTSIDASADDTIVFDTGGSERMRIDSSGQVGINETPVTTAGSAAYLHIDSDGRYNAGTQAAIFQSTSNRGTVRIRTIGDEAAELFWDSNGAARWLMSCRGGTYNMRWYNADGTPSYDAVGSHKMELTQAGNLSVSGSLSKGSGSFKIDHPLKSKKDTHYLVHSFIEGPQADLIYRGKATLSSGTATVDIDTVSGMTSGTFVALNTNVQCFTNNESGWTAVKGSVDGNTLTITAQDNSCTDTISWMVIGERQDPHIKDSETDWTDSNGKVVVEPKKESE